MRLGKSENKARLALALFLLALVLTIALGIGLYSESRREVDDLRLRQLRLESLLLATRLLNEPRPLSDLVLLEHLDRASLVAAATVHASEGAAATASTTSRPPGALIPSIQPRPGPPTPDTIHVRVQEDREIAEVPLDDSRVLVYSRLKGDSGTPLMLYLFSYQVLALLIGIVLILLLIRWLLRPYRRMVEAARDSPIRGSSEKSEAEFVVETFQALIEHLHEKERQLAELHDVERARAERSERFSERLVANIPSGLVAIESSGRVTSANRTALIIFGLAEPAALRTTRELMNPGLKDLDIDFRDFFRSAPAIARMVESCLASGTAFRREEADVMTHDGGMRHLGMSISPISDSTSRLEGALCLMTDITEVVELRERMKLQEGLANLGEMAAGLAHEFKNSLATIQGYIQLLEALASTGTNTQERRNTFEAALKEVRLLAHLVTDFLNFARQQPLNLSEVELDRLIADCATEVGPQLGATDIELKVSGVFPQIEGDESMLRRAVVNLLRNSAEAIDPNSDVRLIEVMGSVEGATGRRYAHIRLRDTGGGIAAEDLPHIFIPFFTTKSRGYGIGLAIVQKIIVAHGGTVSVEKSDSAGTIFDCRLPLDHTHAGNPLP